MPAGTQNLNFQNFPLWVLNIMAKVPSDIFVLKKNEICENLISKFAIVSVSDSNSGSGLGDVLV
jgi:hypothetical protein